MRKVLYAVLAGLAPLLWQQPASAHCTTTGPFAGTYLGATLGFGILNSQQLPTGEPTINRSTTDFSGGGLAGYNVRCGHMVFGGETDLVSLALQSTSSQFSTHYKATSDWYGSVRGRIGTLIDRDTLLYGSMGLAYGSLSHWVQDPGPGSGPGLLQNDKSIATGLILGGGIERMYTDRWALRAEAFWVDLGKEHHDYVITQCGGGTCRSSADWKDNFFTARIGLTLKLDDPPRRYEPLK